MMEAYSAQLAHVAFRWSGGDAPFLDAPDVRQHGHVVVGRYGGCAAAGARKNEDAAMVWAAADGAWTFAALLDAHGSSESADLVLGRIAELETKVVRLLGGSEGLTGRATETPFRDLSEMVVRHFRDDEFRKACAAVRGETALLLCAQRGAYLWWLSVGDIPIYAFHPEFARLGQYALNQRMFFEWIGQMNTFALPVPCFAMGVRQLRPGRSRILLTTDGLLECGARKLENPSALYSCFDGIGDGLFLEECATSALDIVRAENGRDSATLIAWDVDLPQSDAMMQPSA